jgi:hypothetical protein
MGLFWAAVSEGEWRPEVRKVGGSYITQIFIGHSKKCGNGKPLKDRHQARKDIFKRLL